MIAGFLTGLFLMFPLTFLAILFVENYWTQKINKTEVLLNEKINSLLDELKKEREESRKFIDLSKILSQELRLMTHALKAEQQRTPLGDDYPG